MKDLLVLYGVLTLALAVFIAAIIHRILTGGAEVKAKPIQDNKTNWRNF